MSGVGRNDQCPCGSGKKYKRCCMGKNEIPFPHSSESIERLIKQDERFSPSAMLGLSPDQDYDVEMDRYRAYCESLGDEDHIPSFCEFSSGKQDPSNPIHQLQEMMKGQSFNSQEEMEHFLSQKVDEMNHSSHDDLSGLSPLQMRKLLDVEFLANNEAFSINTDLSKDELENTPIVKRVKSFLQLFIENSNNSGAVVLTSTGRFKRAFLIDYFYEVVGDRGAYCWVEREDNYLFFQLLLDFFVEYDYLKYAKTRCYLTHKAEALIQSERYSLIYSEFLEFYYQTCLWDEHSNWENEELAEIYEIHCFWCWYVIGQGTFENEGELYAFFHEYFVKRFFAVLESPSEEIYYKLFKSLFDQLIIDNGLALFGLIEKEYMPENSILRFDEKGDVLLKKSALFDQLIEWKL